MAEKRTEIIRHRVLDEKTGEEHIVEKEFTYNESPDRKIKYITHGLLEQLAKEYKPGDTFATSFRDREEKYEYEDKDGFTTPIIAWRGEIGMSKCIYIFTTVDEYEFRVEVVL